MKQYTINITLADKADKFYKVALSDHNNNMNVVYEESLQDALNYAKTWCEQADERQHAKDVMNKAIMESIALDRIAGITTSTRDSLD